MSINTKILNYDLIFGLKSEKWIKKILEKYLNQNISKLDTYNNFDFKGEKIYIEIKTRRINHNQYKSLMFSKKKLDKGLSHFMDNGSDILFIWRCYDGIYGWYFIKDNEIYDNYTIEMSGRKDRGLDEIEECVHINVHDLFKIEISEEIISSY